MEVCNPKGGRTATPAFLSMLLMMMMSMMLLNAYCCGAAVLAKSNTSFRCTSGRLDECLIEEDLELELLMNPYVSRILAVQTVTGGTKDPNHPAIQPCGQPQDAGYNACIHEKSKPNPHKCDPGRPYNRCPH
ncbi:hypothetical protein CIPAW_03G121700 [Carya illinoinensis]|uniref:Rapid ALkalinization Factor n=1 Tax=Carya illinoinensis TaxID=32201 RepID=A0A8T1R2A4_CARIL|nr:hypothetical protein CIPAW_03G121700 [Carya illinoinensis]